MSEDNDKVKIDWKSIVEYRDGELYFIVDTYRRKKGDKATNTCISKNRRPYKYVSWLNNPHTAARIVWELHNGPVPYGKMVSPLNQNGCDTRIANLRLSDRSAVRHRTAHSEGVGHLRGAFPRYGGNRWVSIIGVNGKQKYLGTFDTEGAAHAAYVAASEMTYEELAHHLIKDEHQD